MIADSGERLGILFLNLGASDEKRNIIKGAAQNTCFRHYRYGMMTLFFDLLRVPHSLRVGKSSMT